MDLSRRAKWYIYLVALGALGLLAYYLPSVRFQSVSHVVGFVILGVLAFLSDIYATRIPLYGGEISSSIAIFLAALFIFGPADTVLLVLLTTLASEVLFRWDQARQRLSLSVHVLLFNISQLVVALGVTGLIFTLLDTPPLFVHVEDLRVLQFAWAVISFLLYAVLNLSLVTGIVALTGGRSFRFALKQCLRDFGLQYLVLCVLALLLGVLNSISFWFVFLAIIPLLLVHVSFRSYIRLQTETRKTFERISRLLDERDHYTAVHSEEVAELSAEIGREMNLPEYRIEQIEIAGKVHDIGKVAVPDSILLKPGPLDDEEWQIMKRHPVVSAELIEGLELYSPIASAVRHEHERWDGSGYPNGLRGDEIPMISRVIAAADIYNALTTDRPYRKAFSDKKALSIVREARGSDLDPQVADALIRILERRIAS